MSRVHSVCIAALSAMLCCCVAPAQMTHGDDTMGTAEHAPAVPSTTLTITGLDGMAKTLTPPEFKAMQRTSVTVTNSHTQKQETYSGVAVKDLLALVAPARVVPVAGAEATKPKISPRMTVIVARGTDGFRVVITLCDTDPDCRSGQAIVADAVDGRPLTTDGAFKLILSEDKKPGRWVRNLDSLTEKNLGGM